MIIRSIVFIFCLLSFSGHSSQIINGDDLFTNSTNSYVQLSPNGRLLSFLEVTDNDRYVHLFDTVEDKIVNSISIGYRSSLRKYYWLDNETLLFDIRRDYKSSLITATIRGKELKVDTLDFTGKIVSLMPSRKNHILFLLDKWRGFKDLFLISIEDFKKGNFDNAQETEFGVGSITQIAYDEISERLLLSKYNPDDESLYYYHQKLGTEHAVRFMKLKDFKNRFYVHHFIDDNTLVVLTNEDNDKVVLRKFNIDTQSLGDIIYAHENYDLVDASYDLSGELFSVGYYEHGIYQRTFFQTDFSGFSNRLRKTFPDSGVYITDSSSDGQKMILNVSGATDPGTYYLYSKDKDSARILMSRHPQLDEIALHKTDKFDVKVDEDTSIEAYLSRPGDNDVSTLLVFPHGGPIGVRETDSFRPEIQYFVSRGFTVLRVNFRGSAGFGKDFQSSGVGQFGQLIEEDIMSAVNHVMAQQNFDNVCAMGASYGGYSSTMLAIKHPDTFKCVVASFGIYDLPLLYNQSNIALHEDNQKRITDVVGEYSDSLKEVSPLYIASRLKAPILLIAGRDDQIASFEHTNRFKYVLEALKHPVETLFYENTGHGHNYWTYDHHEAAVTLDFLSKTLNLDFSGQSETNNEDKAAVADDFLIIADKFEFEDNVPDDEELAFNFLKKAAELEAPRAVFNLGARYHTGTGVDKDLNKALEYYAKAGELGYEGAYLRLGTLYMEGFETEQNWGLAKDYLKKAVDLNNEPTERTRLGRLYCLAPLPEQNIDKCLEYLSIADFGEKSKSFREKAIKALNHNLAWVYSEAKLTPAQLEQLNEFTKKQYDINRLEASMESVDEGVFELIKAEDFGDWDKYELMDDLSTDNIVPNERTRVGVRFEVDLPGRDYKEDRTALIVRWYKETESEGRKADHVTTIHGTPTTNWSTLYNVTEYEEDTHLTLEIFNMNQEKIMQREYFIKVNTEQSNSPALGD